LTRALTHDEFLAFLSRHEGAWEAVSRMIADRLDWANRRRLDFGSYDVPVRLARVLIDLVDRHGRETVDGYELGVPLSQTELGRLVGAGEDRARQSMGQLRDLRFVSTKYRSVVVTDLPGLRRFADFEPRPPLRSGTHPPG
jgi:CRP-like cAMP-binding protein